MTEGKADKDKITYSFGMTVPGAEPYSSLRFDVSLTSEVRFKETDEAAFARVKEFVMEKADDEYERIKRAVK